MNIGKLRQKKRESSAPRAYVRETKECQTGDLTILAEVINLARLKKVKQSVYF